MSPGAHSRTSLELPPGWARWAAAGGLIGAVALASSFIIVPHPPALDAPVSVLNAYARAHRDLLLWSAWLEGTGTFLYVLFLVALAQLAGAMRRLSGVLTALAAAVVLAVSLVYDICLIVFAQSASASGSQLTTGATAYGLYAAVEHAFLIAPAIFLPLGFAIRGSTVLPRAFALTAIVLGCVSEALGLVGLFYAHPNNGGAAGIAINVLIGVEAIWVIAATLFVARRASEHPGVMSPA
jgi:hypothetical protein